MNNNDINAFNKHGDTALMNASRSWGSLQEVQKLLKTKNVDVNVKNEHGYTALWYAVSATVLNINVVAALIAAGADVNVKRFDKTMWEFCVKNGRSEIANMLAEAGAE